MHQPYVQPTIPANQPRKQVNSPKILSHKCQRGHQLLRLPAAALENSYAMPLCRIHAQPAEVTCAAVSVTALGALPPQTQRSTA